MKVIKCIIIVAMVFGYSLASAYSIIACMMVSNNSAGCCLLVIVVGAICLAVNINSFNKWFDSNLRTNNVKTNEENNNPS